MEKFLKRVKGADLAVAVCYKTSGSFCAGFVEEADDEFLCMKFLSGAGRADGWHCIRLEEILKADYSSEFLINLTKVYQKLGGDEEKIKISGKNVLKSFCELAFKNKWLCTFELGFESIEKISGYIVECDWEWERLEVKVISENGKPDGFTSFSPEEIVYVGAQSEYEKFLTTLEEIHAEEKGDGGKSVFAEEKNENAENGAPTEKRVLSFPKKEK